MQFNTHKAIVTAGLSFALMATPALALADIGDDAADTSQDTAGSVETAQAVGTGEVAIPAAVEPEDEFETEKKVEPESVETTEESVETVEEPAGETYSEPASVPVAETRQDGVADDGAAAGPAAADDVIPAAAEPAAAEEVIPAAAEAKSGWVFESGAWRYYDPASHRLVTGQAYVPCGNSEGDESHWYYFDDADGHTTYGWKWIADQQKWAYYAQGWGWMTYGEAYLPCNNERDAPQHWYYFDDATGAVAYQWKYIAGHDKWVYYDPVTATMTYGQAYVPCGNNPGDERHWYYFNDFDGSTTYGWKEIVDQDKWVYYAQGWGWMLKGDQKIGTITYHFDEATGAAVATGNAVETYVQWMLAKAKDDRYGYDQEYRWGERGDYDCSSLTISAVKAAGIDTGSATYTGNMKSNFMAAGFSWLPVDTELQRGDILLNIRQHVAVYLGDGRVVEASGNEYGGATGGQPGDQTGREIRYDRSAYNRSWDGVLRYS